MSDIMRPISFKKMLCWIAEEYGKWREIFGIPDSCFFRKTKNKNIEVFDERCDTPIGPAAGPHTQLAQNIVAAYMTGGRFIELKTVQKLDGLEIEKPCIDARDEGYNTEWSTELSLEQALDEYIKAWILLHLIEIIFNMRTAGRRTFIFNMSVGYDLEGIKTQKMDTFINSLVDASSTPVFNKYLVELDNFVRESGYFRSIGTGIRVEDLNDLSSGISHEIVRSVTLSTMHGCPPEEIEAISRYLLKEKKLHTFVKLNPTLLGYEQVSKILNTLGYGYVKIEHLTFTKDLQYDDAVRMLERLTAYASDCGRGFGIKLSNTLGTSNTAGILPGEEMYMSGRALFPLTITLASRLAREFDGALPISYSGGASQLNILQIFETGIRPITMATDLLKPGGYLRMSEMARILDYHAADQKGSDLIDIEKLDLLAGDVLNEEYYSKVWRGTGEVSVDRKLPMTDCYVAPCVIACPIRQDIPEYIRLAGEGLFDRALELIYLKNPLPNITGHICDHQCGFNCTRLDYDSPVNIREVKRIAAVQAKKAYGSVGKINGGKLDTKAAVIGAGPAGLAASFFLAENGFRVTVFEKKESPGGVVRYVLPNFRIPVSAFKKDISKIKELGVNFKFGVPENFSIKELKNQDYKYIFISIGAEVSKKLRLEGDNDRVFDALDFLRSFNTDPGSLNPGRRVAVIGGGNTAMDSARAALKLSGVDEVYIIYRRTKNEMPADMEEFDNAVKEGVVFKSLLLPESFFSYGILKCRKMVLGSIDSTGRRQPEPTGEFCEIAVDSVISAIGEHTDFKMLVESGLKLRADGSLKVDPETLETDVENVFIGGDAFRGPSTVVESIADARRAVTAISVKELPDREVPDGYFNPGFDRNQQIAEILKKKGLLRSGKLWDKSDKSDNSGKDREIAENEALRCLECNVVCDKCVDVCPNRANLAVTVDEIEGFKNTRQILHLDALCNECGNCGTFCPYDGLPYRDKLTLFNLKEDFDSSENNGFIFSGKSENLLIDLRLEGSRIKLKQGDEKKLVVADTGSNNFRNIDEIHDIPELGGVSKIISAILRDYSYLIEDV
jgi:putative selenate reductase